MSFSIENISSENDIDCASLLVDPKTVLNSIGEVIYDWSLATDELRWGANVAQVLGLSSSSGIVCGEQYAEFIQHKTGVSRYEALFRTTQLDTGDGVPFRTQYALKMPQNQKMLWVEDTGRWFAGSDGKPAYVHGVIRLINDQMAENEHILNVSRLDPLTHLFNRGYLTELLEQNLSETLVSGESFGFLLASIDNLSVINASYGFDVADEVIAAVAKRIHSRMRARDILARYSGNKFGIILKKCEQADVPVAAERFIRGVRDEVIHTAIGPVSATLTVGAILAPRHGRTVAEIMQRTHETLDLAKNRRRGAVSIYSPSKERENARTHMMRLTDEMITALNDRRLVVGFQPIVDAHTKAIHGYECLARIHREDGSVISAGLAVPFFEKLGLIRLLDHRILELALQKLSEDMQIRLSINVSSETTYDIDWRNTLVSFMQQYPGIGERLTIELTETALIESMDEIQDFVSTVKAYGCKIAIDDFGSGHTSFKNLKVLQVDSVKIDGAFVQNILTSADDRFFVRTLVELAKHLGAKTVAEWVQDEESAKLLAEIGIDYLQGFYLGEAELAPNYIEKPNLKYA